MFGRILLLLLITPIVELALLIQLGDVIGFWPTIAIIVTTALLGSYLLRREGLSVWRRFNERLNRGDLPGTELLDGVIIIVAGALLITPGVLTDVAGFTGLLPLTRKPLRAFVQRRIEAAVKKGTVRVQHSMFGTMSPPETPDESAWGGQPADAPRYRRHEDVDREQG